MTNHQKNVTSTGRRGGGGAQRNTQREREKALLGSLSPRTRRPSLTVLLNVKDADRHFYWSVSVHYKEEWETVSQETLLLQT